MPAADLTYRCAAVHAASPADLVIILYDILLDDLRHAIAAMSSGLIEERSRCLKHALLALELLEGSLDMENGGVTARSLAAFYAHVRRRILDAQFQGDDRILADQITLILDVRQAWRTAEAPAPAHLTAAAINPDDTDFRQASRWSA